jgi:TRAP-type C4-dicarboxylate transport system permease small subunit
MSMQVNKPVTDRLLRVVSLLSTVGAVLSGTTFVFMTLLILTEVLLRTFFDKSTLIASEYSGYSLAVMIYLGLGFSFRQGAHIRITFLRERLRGWALHIMELLCTSVASLLCLLSTVFLSEMVYTSFQRGTTAYTVAETPLWVPQAIILVGLTILTLQVIAYLLFLVMHGPGAVESGKVDI